MENPRYKKLLISNGLGGLLKDYLDAEGLPASACRARIAGWKADGRIPITEWIAALALISKEYPKPALGLAIGRNAKPHHMGMLGYLLLSSDNLGEVIERISRFYELAWGGIAVPITRTADMVTISWVMPVGIPIQSGMVQLSHETGLAGLVTLVRQLCGAPVNPVAIDMGGPEPARPELYAQFFHCRVTFGAPAASISFSSCSLGLPIRTGSGGLQEYAERQAEARLAVLVRNDALLTALHTVLLKALHEGQPTIVHVSKAIGMSRTTLQRRLEERGLTFRRFLDQTRLELARMYLADPGLALTEIAWLLAFSEQSAFSRSFRRWTGSSPFSYRRAASITP